MKMFYLPPPMQMFCNLTYSTISAKDKILSGATVVYHLWYYDEELTSRVVLSVKSSNCRIWSVKELLDDSPGAWRVEIHAADGNQLEELNFDLRYRAF